MSNNIRMPTPPTSLKLHQAMNSTIDSILQEEGVKGVVWNDAQGLLLSSNGDFGNEKSGYGAFNTLVAHAKSLGNDEAIPVIRLDTTKRRVFVHQQTDGSVLAVSTQLEN